MGAWAHGSFDNDNALDWRHDFEAKGSNAITLALSTVTGLPEDECPGTTAACKAIAAAEVVAAANDGDASKLPESVSRALATHRHAIDPTTLLPQASSAVDRILRESELKELWEGSEEWLAEMKALQARLRH
jgi:uncharacterized protein DUF4259